MGPPAGTAGRRSADFAAAFGPHRAARPRTHQPGDLARLERRRRWIAQGTDRPGAAGDPAGGAGRGLRRGGGPRARRDTWAGSHGAGGGRAGGGDPRGLAGDALGGGFGRGGRHLPGGRAAMRRAGSDRSHRRLGLFAPRGDRDRRDPRRGAPARRPRPVARGDRLGGAIGVLGRP